MSKNSYDKQNRFISAIVLILLPICVLSYLGFLTYFGPPKKPRLKNFVAQIDKKGKPLLNEVGDTLWHKIPDFTFVNENGEKVTESIMDSMIVVADYFFTTCPGICIPMSKNLYKVQEYFDPDEKVKILSHTVDPETDSPAVLKEYAEQYGANPKQWTFLTGSKKDLYRHARKGYFITATEGNGDAEDFIHSEKLVLIDMHKNIRGYFDGTDIKAVDRLIQSIEILQLEHKVHKKYR